MKRLICVSGGKLQFEELENPSISGVGVVTMTSYSAISPGTEGDWVIGQRNAKPEKSSPRRLGYATAGIVLEKHKDIDFVKPGDKVACVGYHEPGANHATYNFIPKYFFVKVPDNVSLQDASFTAIGGISFASVRRAKIELGEFVLLVGQGILGLFGTQLVNLCGGRVIATDLIQYRLNLAKKLGAELVLNANEDIYTPIMNLTKGRGVDKVIIFAGIDVKGTEDERMKRSLEIVRQGVRLCRPEGRVVTVGALSAMPVPGEYYVTHSCQAWGPGETNPDYKDKYIDYPYNYVRWSQQRNLEEFQRLLSLGKIDVHSLITHEFQFEDAENAFEQIIERPQETIGVVLKY